MSSIIVLHSFPEKNKSILIGRVPFLELLGKVHVSYRTVESGEDYQRQIDDDRVKAIAKYIVRCIAANEKGGTNIVFPNSIILACDNESETKEVFCEGLLSPHFIIPDGTMIVDGQHRYSGVKYLYEHARMYPTVYGFQSSEILRYLSDFCFSCTILLNFDRWEQAQVFATVNFNQKKVSKSLFYDIYGVDIPLDDSNVIPRQNEIYLAHELVVFLENDTSSVFRGFIKMLGTGSGYVSQSFVVEALLKHLSPRGIWSDAVEMLKQNDMRYKYVAHELLAYMAAVRFTFKSLWPEEVEEKPTSVLCKTTGIGAILALIKDGHYAMPNSDMKDMKEMPFSPTTYAKTISFFKSFLTPLRDYADELFRLEGEFARGAGAGMQASLYKRMKDILLIER